MNKYLMLLLWLIVVSCQFPSKSRKAGNLSEIIFKEVSVIEDSSQYLISLNKSKTAFRDALAQSLKEELNDFSEEKVDSLVDLQMKFVPFIYDQADNDTIYHIAKYMDSIILTYKAVNNFSNVRGDYMMINPAKKTAQFLAKRDSVTIYDEVPYELFLKEELAIKEYPMIIKNIAGYECFKLETTKTDSIEGWIVNKKQTMYVTSQIRNLYHPVIKSDEILSKYFPLEIKKKSIDGVYKHFSVEYVD